jgi:hypothetical protein
MGGYVSSTLQNARPMRGGGRRKLANSFLILDLGGPVPDWPLCGSARSHYSSLILPWSFFFCSWSPFPPCWASPLCSIIELRPYSDQFPTQLLSLFQSLSPLFSLPWPVLASAIPQMHQEGSATGSMPWLLPLAEDIFPSLSLVPSLCLDAFWTFI